MLARLGRMQTKKVERKMSSDRKYDPIDVRVEAIHSPRLVEDYKLPPLSIAVEAIKAHHGRYTRTYKLYIWTGSSLPVCTASLADILRTGTR